VLGGGIGGKAGARADVALRPGRFEQGGFYWA